MVKNYRNNWHNRIKQVIRSRHYSWLAEARDGEPIDKVMTDVIADVMHICEHEGSEWEQLEQDARAQFKAEEFDGAARTEGVAPC